MADEPKRHPLASNPLEIELCSCNCITCNKGMFWVRNHPDFHPVFCPYCGVRFIGHQVDNGPMLPYGSK